MRVLEGGAELHFLCVVDWWGPLMLLSGIAEEETQRCTMGSEVGSGMVLSRTPHPGGGRIGFEGAEGW